MANPKYVIATDLSPHSRKAAQVAVTLARRIHADLDFLCVLPLGVVDKYRVGPSHVRDLVQTLADRHAHGLTCTAHVAVANDVPRAIAQRARDARASLVVVAPHGVTGWRKVLLGSVARRVLAESPISVLLARGTRRGARGPVLVGVDLGPRTGAVLRHAVAVARALGADLDVVHVVPPVEILLPMVGPIAVAKPRIAVPARELARLVERLPHRGVRVSTRAIEGSPAETLLGHARRSLARMIVVGATTKSRMRRAFLGSVAHAVASAGPVSVLVVRE